MKKFRLALAAGLLASSASAAHAQNLLDNGNFSQNIEMTAGRWNPTHWLANQKYTLPFETFYSQVTWVSPGEPWQWNVSYPLPLEAGTEYRFRFSARVASGTGKITAGWGMNQAPWSADAREYALTEAWQTFEFVGVPSFGGFQNSRLIFDYGHQLQTVFIDDVVFEDTHNLITNGGFQSGLSGWSASGARQVVGGVYVGSVATAGERWTANLSHPVALETDATYKLRFRAKSGPGQGGYIVAGFGRNQAPWDAATKSLYVGDAWRSYEVIATVPYANAAISRLLFDYGQHVGDLFIDDVTLEQVETLVTDGGVHQLGVQPDGSVLEFVSERVTNGYLQPSSSQKPYSSWITTRPEAHDLTGPLLRRGIAEVGTYVQDCDTLDWVNVQQTELTSGTQLVANVPTQGSYQVRLGMAPAAANEPQLRGNFVCDRSQGGMLEVFYNGVYTLFPADGVTTVGYLLRHTP
jgi:hypothetical protein